MRTQPLSPRTFLLARLAFRSIRQNWRHSLATMLAILGGFAAVSLFDGFLAAIRAYNGDHYVHKGMTGHVIVEKRGAAEHLFEDTWLYSLTREEQEKTLALVDQDPRLAVRMKYLIINGLISNGRNSAIFIGAGYDEEAGRRIRGARWDWNVIAGKPLAEAPPGGGIMMGTGLAQRMGCDFDPVVRLNAEGSYVAEPRPLTCAARTFQLSVTTEHAQVNALNLPPLSVTDMVIREFNDKVIAMPLETAQRLFDTDRITRVIVLLKDESQARSFARDLERNAAATGLDLEALPWMEHPVAAVAKGGMEVLGVFRLLFLGVVAVIAAMSVANSMMKSINERIREIGSLRSFGFRRRDIVLLFSFEGLFLGLFSCLAGIALSVLLAFVLSNVGLTFKAGILSSPMPVKFAMALSVWAVTALTLSAITFLASWAVSHRAANMVIADALRHTA